ncbi:hypothetical protein [Rhodococcoides yunnanense]|uniref:hypothetical protein n=1 Tax=Rhodococcoides yunnanense TaxID=278209 RepID=UPI0009326713|nr:hypothetical protein [Rhodococcus yunnanensis]
MSHNTFRVIATAAMVGAIGFSGAALASADTIVKPGTEKGAYCTVVDEDGAVSHLQTPAQCLQAQVATNIAERKAAAEEARKERAAERRN